MTKTTLYIEDSMLVSLRAMARAEGRKQSEIIREALDGYLKSRQRPYPKGIGAYSSGRSDLSERAEELLAQRERPGS